MEISSIANKSINPAINTLSVTFGRSDNRFACDLAREPFHIHYDKCMDNIFMLCPDDIGSIQRRVEVVTIIIIIKALATRTRV